jgi:hypothetical protein
VLTSGRLGTSANHAICHLTPQSKDLHLNTIRTPSNSTRPTSIRPIVDWISVPPVSPAEPFSDGRQTMRQEDARYMRGREINNQRRGTSAGQRCGDATRECIGLDGSCPYATRGQVMSGTMIRGMTFRSRWGDHEHSLLVICISPHEAVVYTLRISRAWDVSSSTKRYKPSIKHHYTTQVEPRPIHLQHLGHQLLLHLGN